MLQKFFFSWRFIGFLYVLGFVGYDYELMSFCFHFKHYGTTIDVDWVEKKNKSVLLIDRNVRDFRNARLPGPSTQQNFVKNNLSNSEYLIGNETIQQIQFNVFNKIRIFSRRG